MQVDGYGGIQNTGANAPRPDDAKKAAQSNRTENERPRDVREQQSSNDQGDTVEISARANELLAARQAEKTEATGDDNTVRAEAVERARQILQSGTYNNAGTLDRTAEALGQLFRSEG
jgi:hypothetical protein